MARMSSVMARGMSMLLASGRCSAKCDDDGRSTIAVVAHAQREVLNAATGREQSGFATKDERAAAGLVSAHFDRAPIDPMTFRLQRLHRGFFRGETRGQARGSGGGRGRTAITCLPSSENAANVAVAETVKRSRYLRHTHEVEADRQVQ